MEGDLVGETFASSMRSCSLDLIGIIVQTDNAASGEDRNLPGRLADTTPNIKDSHRLVDLDSMSEIMFMASESLEQSFPSPETTQVERLSPSFLVEVCG